ncbi:poly [ADP-ribose] polymerase 1-like [Amphibalanus amphitrite]|uniref:poly [ADP-ribose] polymerase 1-like n=1 Tax=Amphibalanus amphitrite TaxID=1232801 RepID=UPI001C92312E|nr:poly [ADP-ribose] polymerase 1-like [Amphibalanus amphitrite]XP_043217136.1 poly [ADP-ribose] polymerase 1-like [Amphibalanus amphitrite]
MSDDLPFRAEYSKSGRAGCKGCKGNIAKDTLRMAAMVQSPFFDGKMAKWYHFSCFFEKQKPKAVADIGHFESLRFEDQEKIRAKIGAGGATGDAGAGTSKAAKAKATKQALQDFLAEYAKSGAAKCRKCEEKILKGEVRLGKKVYDSERARAYGPYMGWHHVDCFVKDRETLEFFEEGAKMPGLKTLSKEDQQMVKAKLKKIEGKRPAEDAVDGPSKKPKKEEAGPDRSKLKKQSQLVFGFRDQLKKLGKRELQLLLEENDQEVPSGTERMLDRLSDGMAFGALLPCPLCKNGQLVFRSGVGYQCVGQLTEWTKCTNVVKVPKRRLFKVPKELAEEYPFLASYKCKLGDRLMEDLGQTSATMQQEKVKAQLNATPLTKLTFAVAGDVDEEVVKRVQRMGGKLAKSVTAHVAAVICTKATMDGGHKLLKAALKHSVHVIPPEAVDKLKAGAVFKTIEETNMADWGGKVEERLGAKEETFNKSGASKSMFDKKSMTKSQRVRLKGGAAVDPDSGLEDEAHVYQSGGDFLNAVLSQVDAGSGQNSFYKLQVLQADYGSSMWVFRAWGRLGTTVGGNKLEEFDSIHDAVREFKRLYEEKTGNRWEGRKDFQKVPGRFYPMDLDYGEHEEAMKKLSAEGSKSKLDKAVQELICTIFDVNTMKQAMVEFDIDMEKMPLGKISKNQMKKAFEILTEAQALVEKKGDPAAKAPLLLDCSNRFFTLIPHDFGMQKPPLLDNLDIIKEKVDMVSSLMDIELAYSLMKAADKIQSAEHEDPVDTHYKKLNADITVLERDSEKFRLLETYIKNTHASTHSNYTLELEQVFCVSRKGEATRYKPFSKLHNRKLLWHGSRLSNFAGILSQGLRIAPPEAPATGYMFGKGIYFADMVSKSANYCFASHTNPRGLLLLCEVALGNMYEKKHSEYITKLPTGKHSTKGLGKTHPDPKESHLLETKVEIPLGKPTKSTASDTSLLYNEYIVYDVAQAHIQYLLQVNFNFRR